MLTEITLKDFRCFHDEQTARLAPLTLLVGENSTGKTSFMAMIRAMWELAYGGTTPDFKAPPYDLGSFDEIAHSRGARGSQAKVFEASVSVPSDSIRSESRDNPVTLGAEFVRRGTAPALLRRYLSAGATQVEQTVDEEGWARARVCTGRGEWEWSRRFDANNIDSQNLPWSFLYVDIAVATERPDQNEFVPVASSTPLGLADLKELTTALHHFPSWMPSAQRPYASAPVRSTPQRTYDPARPTRDPFGDYVPMYLAEIAAQNGTGWETLKSALEEFGGASGLFDEIRVHRFSKSANAPFQLQVRKGGKGRKGPWRNLIDVGYGVSQILPVITELLRPDAPQISLWQQPEVHLHPSAQAALATFFCGLAANGKQLIVETHGDYLLDRVRMDVRDGKTGLKPEDVCVLYFERTGLDVQIHSLRFDAQGNVLDVPPGYRQFFLEEVNRSLGI